MTIYQDAIPTGESSPDEYSASMGEALSASAQDALLFSPSSSLFRAGNLALAHRQTDTMLTQDQAQAKATAAGVKLDFGKEAISQAAADLMIERKQREMAIQDTIARGPQGVMPGTAKFLTSIGASLLDPLNLAASFVPVVGQARTAGMLARAGGTMGRVLPRAGIGAVEGLVGGALVMPVIYGAAKYEQADFDMADAAFGVAFGGVLGAAAHTVGGSAADLWRGFRGTPDPYSPFKGLSTDEIKTALKVRREATRQGVTDADIQKLLDEHPANILQAAGLMHPGVDAPQTQINPGTVYGADTRIKIRGNYVGARWAVVDLDHVEATMTRADNQWRDRTRGASSIQVREIANNPDFNMLHDSATMDTGAPTLSRDGLVIGGNGRVMGVSQSYEFGRAYREQMNGELSRFGIDPASVEGMKKPMLVRILSEDVDVKEAAIASNEGGSSVMSAYEQAAVDAHQLGDFLGFEVPESGDMNTATNRQAIRDWVGRYDATQVGGLVTPDLRLSPQGNLRLRNAILYRAYGDSPILRTLIEGTDEASSRLSNALIRVAATIAEARAGIKAGILHDLDISQELQDAVRLLKDIRGNDASPGMTYEQWEAQGQLFGVDIDPVTRQLLQFLDANISRPRTVAELIKAYYRSLDSAGDPNQFDMLGPAIPTKQDLLNRALVAVNRDTSAADVVGGLAPETRQAAMRTAVSQLADGRAVEVTGLVETDPTIGTATPDSLRAEATHSLSVENHLTADTEASADVETRSQSNLTTAEEALTESLDLLSNLESNPDYRYSMGDLTQRSKALAGRLRGFFGRRFDALLNSGRVKIVDTVEELNWLTDSEHPADVQAMHDPKTGITYLVAENISDVTARGIALHDIGVHAGMEEMLGPDLFRSLADEARQRADAGEAEFAKALDNVPEGTNPDHVNEEILGYLVENAPHLPLVKRIISAIRAWAWRNLESARGRMVLSDAEIASLAAASLRRQGKNAKASIRSGSPFHSIGPGDVRYSLKSEERVQEVKDRLFESSAPHEEDTPFFPSTEADIRKAVEYERENGILPYLSAGQIEVPVHDALYSIKRAHKPEAAKEGYHNHPVFGLPLNKNGTITLYFPTTNEHARRVIRDKRISAQDKNANRVYLTNESSARALMERPGQIEQEIGGANVLVHVDPALLQLDMIHEDGRVDFFIPLAEGQAFANKMKQTKLFTLFKSRNEEISADVTFDDMASGIKSGVDEFSAITDQKKRAAFVKKARAILKSEHNVGTLLTENGKLEKTRVGDYGLTYDGHSVASLGLGLAAAQKLNAKRLSTCINAAMCKLLCLGETSGQNLLYGGEGPFRSGSRLSQYLKTEALVMHPREFSIILADEIERFTRWAAAETERKKNPETKKMEKVKKEFFQASIRLNMTSDIPPFVYESLIGHFKDVMFYDYTKLDSKVIAPNHHLTYSSTGVSQIVNGETVFNHGQNWSRMMAKLNNGQNVAMAFTDRDHMPSFVIDEVTGQKFQVWNGDNYDARFLDPKSDDGVGMIIGLTNKDNTTHPGIAAKAHNGFFVDYQPAVHGDTVVIPDQSKITRLSDIKYSRRKADEVLYSIRQKPAPKKTVKAFKLFRVDPRRPGELFPLFVDASTPVPVGKWLDADVGEMTAGGKVKSKLGPLAFRPGWHAGDLPLATHIGEGGQPPQFRPANQVWAEVEMAADRDWQSVANERGKNANGKIVPVKAHITDQIPEDGFYRYKTNSNMTGNWLIGGSIKVVRVLSDDEVKSINDEAGHADLPRKQPADLAAMGFGEEVKYSRHHKVEEGQTHIDVDGVQRPAQNSEGRPIHPTEEGVQNFWRWFGDSKVVDDQGRPMVVYRGEHGADPGQPKTRLGSYSFGSRDAASEYARMPNNRADMADSPTVIPAYLRIRRPIINTPDDSFVELSAISNALGHDEAVRIARKFGDDIENTSHWQDDISQNGRYASVDEFLSAHPDQVNDLYFDAYRYLDDAEEVARLRYAGYDGAIHGGNGTTAMEAEYKVFDPEQIKSATDNTGEFSPESSDIRYSRQQQGQGGGQQQPNLQAQLQPFDEAIRRAGMARDALRAAAASLGNQAQARAAMQAATGGNLAADEIDQLLRTLTSHYRVVRGQVRRVRDRMTADDVSTALQDDAMRAADELANNIEMAAVIAKRNAALSLAAKTRNHNFVAGEFGGMQIEGLLATLGGSEHRRFGARSSVTGEQKQFLGKWMGGFIADMEREGLWELYLSDTMARETARALFLRDTPGANMAGIPPQAVRMADIIHKYQEDARNTQNRFGAWIRDARGYIVRQTHDMSKIRAAGFEAWRDFVLPRIDLIRTFADRGVEEEHIEDSLLAMYQNFASGIHTQLEPEQELSEAFSGMGMSVAKKQSASKTLYFTDADAWFDYNENFGTHGFSEAVLHGLDRSSRAAGLMKVWGPNPEANLTRVMDELENGMRFSPEARLRFHEERGTVMNLFAHVSGAADIPGSQMGAQISAGLRAWQSMAKLGGAVISSVTDIPTYGAEQRFQGRSMLSGMHDAIAGLMQGRGSAEQREIMNSLGVFFESMTHGIAARFHDGDGVPGQMSGLMQKFFKWNGLTWWTETLRKSAALSLSNHLAEMTSLSWKNLREEYRNLFSLYNLTEAKWDLLRMSSTREADGRRYLTPEGVHAIPDAALENYILNAGRTLNDAAVRNFREDLAGSLRSLIIDRMEHAVIEPDARTKAFMLRGTRPGTVWGEVARFIAQFKSFSVAMFQKVWGREIYGRGYDTLGDYLRRGRGDMLGLVQLMLWQIAFGYGAMVAKDLIKGRTPRSPLAPATWAAAFVQGGGAGIYGDFLFGDMRNRFGGGLLTTLAGPVFGAGEDVLDLYARVKNGDDAAAKAFRLITSNTPFLNMFYTRTALDYLLFYNIQESLNPGYLRRMERRIEKENAQTFLVRPSEHHLELH